MLTEFKTDLAKAKTAEQIVLAALSNYSSYWTLEDISEDRSCYYLGDIKATYAGTGVVQYIEVKDDSRIHETKNILCEEENYLKDDGRYIKGNMHCESDIFCVVSE